jgi:hypothetical protein
MGFIPKLEVHGGSRVGTSYLNTFANCPKKWFNTFLRPVEVADRDGNIVLAQGIRPQTTALPLVSGSIFHEGLAEWYRSGVRDGADTGQYDTDRAIETARMHWKDRIREYEPDVSAEDDWAKNQKLLLDYFTRYGPESQTPDFPDLIVATDSDGEPLVEREFVTELGYSDYIFTCRVDMICHHRGFLKVMEHKTSVPGFVRQRLNVSQWDSQMTAECWVLREEFPDDPLNGVLVNVVVKDRSLRSQTFDVAERATTTRTDAQLDQFPLNAVDILRQIDERVAGFEFDVAEGRDLEHCAQKWFPDHGTRTGACMAYNRECDYAPICKLAGRESSAIQAYRPRTTVEKLQLMEYS